MIANRLQTEVKICRIITSFHKKHFNHGILFDFIGAKAKCQLTGVGLTMINIDSYFNKSNKYFLLDCFLT